MLYYHGTVDKLIPSIKAKGLVPHGSRGATAMARGIAPLFGGVGLFPQDERADRRESVYVTSNRNIAAWFAASLAFWQNAKPALVEFNLQNTELVVDEAFAGPDSAWSGLGFRHLGAIEPSKLANIEILTDRRYLNRVMMADNYGLINL